MSENAAGTPFDSKALLASRLRKGTYSDDWYVVDGSWGQPEGTAEEWRGVLAAIRCRESRTTGRRVGVTVLENGGIELYSPRNMTTENDVVRISKDELPFWVNAAERLLANTNIRQTDFRNTARKEST